jgi:hypothetical protein
MVRDVLVGRIEAPWSAVSFGLSASREYEVMGHLEQLRQVVTCHEKPAVKYRMETAIPVIVP